MPKKLDLTGQRFGRLVVIEPSENKGKRTTWKCLCDCRKECIVLTESLRSNKVNSCGCLRSEKTTERNQRNFIDLTGQRFGKLVVIKKSQNSKREHSCWICQCDCGNIKEVCSVELKRGDTLSCGCLRSSFGESKIEQILKDNNISYKKEYEFSDLLSENQIPLRFDFVIFNNGKISRIIEYDGEQHFLDKTNNFWKNDSLEKRKSRDKQKNEYCLKHNYQIVRIPYWEKNNISLELILGDKYLVQ